MSRAGAWFLGRRRLLLSVAIALSAASAAALLWLCPDGLWLHGDIAPYVARRHGHLLGATIERTDEGQGGYVTRYVRLASSSGLEVDLAVKLPASPGNDRLPLVLLIAGFYIGRDAVGLIDEPGRTVVAAVSHPLAGERRIPRGLGALAVLPRFRQSMHDGPAALMLALDYLLAQPEVDPRRVELVGVSLGSVPACVAGGLDARFTRVWSVQGGAGDPLLEGAVGHRVRSAALRRASVAFLHLLFHRIDPATHVPHIAPRELVLINAEQDRLISHAAADLLYESAREPKQRIWLDTTHVRPDRKDVIGGLMATVLARIHGGADDGTRP